VSPFTQPRQVAQPALRLVVFHHAGGSAAAYFPLARSLPGDWDVLLLDLPGRGKRMRAAPIEDMAQLVGVAVADVLPWAQGAPIALFGHSLGAIVAAETARHLEARGARPAWVGVSGAVAPEHRASARLPGHDRPDAELLAELAGMGGMPDQIDEVPEFRDRVLRLVRADLRALATYHAEPGREPLTAPLTVFSATDDVWVPPPMLPAWAHETCGPVRQRMFTGGHWHFLGAALPAFAAEVAQEASRYLPALTRPAGRCAGPGVTCGPRAATGGRRGLGGPTI
jgi:surfactin synthase thioesterase subunit